LQADSACTVQFAPISAGRLAPHHERLTLMVRVFARGGFVQAALATVLRGTCDFGAAADELDVESVRR